MNGIPTVIRLCMMPWLEWPNLGHYEVPLVDGHGNFGSLDGDPPGGLSLYGSSFGTSRSWNFFQNSIKKPLIFAQITMEKEKNHSSCRRGTLTCLLMDRPVSRLAWPPTSHPHNLGEVIEAAIALIDKRDASVTDLMKISQRTRFSHRGRDSE